MRSCPGLLHKASRLGANHAYSWKRQARCSFCQTRKLETSGQRHIVEKELQPLRPGEVEEDHMDWSRMVAADPEFNHGSTAALPIHLKDKASPKKIWYNLALHAREYNPTSLEEIPRLRTPDPTEFYVNFVSKGKPVILEGLLDSSFALKFWTQEYFKTVMKNAEVDVCSSPSGIFDHIVQDKAGREAGPPTLARPRVQRMKFDEFSNLAHAAGDPTVLHTVRPGVGESSNLQGQFKSVNMDVPLNLPLAEHLVSCSRNLWISQPGARYSLRFEFQEYFDCLLSGGARKWMLVPPTDLPFLYFNYFPEGHYEFYEPPPPEDKNADRDPPEWTILRSTEERDQDEEKVPWIEADPSEKHELYPRAANCSPLFYTQQPGETIFIPATWHHQVTTTADPSYSVSYGYSAHNPSVLTNYFLLVQFDKYGRQIERPDRPRRPPSAPSDSSSSSSSSSSASSSSSSSSSSSVPSSSSSSTSSPSSYPLSPPPER